LVRTCGIVLTKDEEPRIEECLSHLKPYVGYIVVLDDESVDKTVAIAEKHADKVVVKHVGPGMAEKRNYAMRLVPKWCGWILFCDADERFDRYWLEKMKQAKESELPGTRIMSVGASEITEFGADINCVRFPRVNLPTGMNYPDYQVRFFRRKPGFEWRNEGDPSLGNDVLYSKRPNKRLDQLPGVTTLDYCPLLHLPRRTDIRRPWW